MTPLTEKKVASFWSKVLVLGPDDCWPWTGYLDHDGYGRFRTPDGYERAHRVAYKIGGNLLSDEQQALHSCDNPPCCNPRHIHPGTNLLNVWEKVSRRRQSRGAAHSASFQPGSHAGVRNGRAKLRPQQVDEIRCLANLFGADRVGRWYGISKPHVFRIWGGEVW